MAIVAQQRETVGIAPACAALSVPRATFYRRQKPKGALSRPPRRIPRALPPNERAMVLSMLNDDRFADLPPAEVYATLLDEGKFVCSISTMYRILRENNQVKERRDQLRHPFSSAPELLATRPNKLWSWDITKLKGPAKWVYFYLYVILDVFSRYVVGWMVAYQESAALAKRLITKTCQWQKIEPGQLTIHADRGSSMTSKPVALLLSDLGVTKTHGRPHVSNDNPYSESQFKTLKYKSGFPDRFGSIQDARAFCIDFFPWYNTMHHHGSLGLLTPFDVHYGLGAKRTEERALVLRKAYEANPVRFVRGVPKPPAIPKEVWINKPRTRKDDPDVLDIDF
jgi:putative transposase